MARTYNRKTPVVAAAKIEKTEARTGRKPSNVRKVPSGFTVDARLIAGVDAMIEKQAIKPSRSAVFTAALESFLASNGVDWASMEATEGSAMADAAE